VPIRTQGHDGRVQFRSDAAAHGHDHALAFEDLLPLLEVGHDVAGHVLDAVLAADERLQLGPLGLGFLRVGELLLVQVVVEVLDQLLAFLGQVHLGQAALVVDAHRGAVLHGLRDVVHVHVVAEDRRGVIALGYLGVPRLKCSRVALSAVLLARITALRGAAPIAHAKCGNRSHLYNSLRVTTNVLMPCYPGS